MILLEAKNIEKSFVENIKVLRGVSLTVQKGDFISIEGASGSGKSTLLTILGGIDRPDSGEVLFCGEDIAKMTEKELAILRRTKIGFVFQFFNLAPYLTVFENVLLPIILDKKKVSEYENKALDLLKDLGIYEYKDRLPAALSGGEQQRVAIARGLIFSPDVIMLDEPTGNLDSVNSAGIMDLLKRINLELGTTIIQVTHSRENAEYGNRKIVIKDGIILNGNDGVEG
ncbi:MAG: Lipoprotein-releasing system ATP-binding protein LolD [Firmicutes bacterium ADurb.Bin080]|jgi:putative ABC transport system ATP-binding protein|nr:ABC transporter ATP-binding protein [Clostridiales bacterium]OQC15570.1 MAG: Lipoprotein-releasing system ATP-binding protein LolD [Firmicutes bacterium ADurb.Bin080]